LLVPLLLAALGCVATLILVSNAVGAQDSSEVAGIIRDADGKPIANAWVTDGTSYTFTDNQGTFVFDSGKVVPGSSLIVSSSGFQQERIVAPHNGAPVEITMTDSAVRGIYFNPMLSNTPEGVASFIHIAKTTEVNAVVIDIKEHVVYFDTDIAVFRDANMVLPILDLPWLINEFHKNGIYVIARIVVFKDSPVAEHYPQYAVLDSYTGGLWRDQNGAAWVNPLNREMWDANIRLAEEVIALGFDEVQYDYIRFPTDGDMARAWFGPDYSPERREAAIEGFLSESRDRIIPMGGRQSADVFGYTTIIDHDLGIGQNFDSLAGTVDYISPMIYPSHWPAGSLYGVPGHPNDHPYLTVSISMDAAVSQLDGNRRQLRPWLQDFGLPGQRMYGSYEVRAQIDALNDLGINSWLIWSFNGWFHVDAFKPDTSRDIVPTAVPASTTPAATPAAPQRSPAGQSARRRRGSC
jgi:hypothetical protein